MKTNALTLGLAVIGLVTFTSAAGPVQRGDIPAEAGWVLHMDCDAVRPTTIGQYLIAEMSKPEPDAKFAAFQSIFSFDPRNALHGMTLYSTGKEPQDGVLIIYATFDYGRLVTLAKAANGYQSTPHRTQTIHNWIDNKKPEVNGVKPRTYAAIVGNRVIFGQSEAKVAQALDAMDGISASLGTSKAVLPSLGAPARTGMFLQAAGRKFDVTNTDPNAAVIRMSDTASVEMGETDGNVAATMILEAKDAEVAGHITSIAQGIVSLMKLDKEKPASIKLAEAMTVQQEDAKVLVKMSMPATAVVDAMKAAAAKKAAATTN